MDKSIKRNLDREEQISRLADKKRAHLRSFLLTVLFIMNIALIMKSIKLFLKMKQESVLQAKIHSQIE